MQKKQWIFFVSIGLRPIRCEIHVHIVSYIVETLAMFPRERSRTACLVLHLELTFSLDPVELLYYNYYWATHTQLHFTSNTESEIIRFSCNSAYTIHRHPSPTVNLQKCCRSKVYVSVVVVASPHQTQRRYRSLYQAITQQNN